jgi:hypothetical protein
VNPMQVKTVTIDSRRSHPANARGDGKRKRRPVIAPRFEVIVKCDDESAQKQMYERLTAEGLPCRLLTL